MQNWKLFYLWALIKITFSFNVLHQGVLLEANDMNFQADGLRKKCDSGIVMRFCRSLFIAGKSIFVVA